ncbi:hypothetical protein [Janthinobacterium sp. B9-8]|uniref:hypothetical protein n=1 Tax=Janthinobacterium sp. B9-8 TaxID=1236179 RepID=UPI00061CFABC|nr:hypothetical protein [Janthinobacterium sp. B9-8]AMC35110.1 hypothetical protein VN23_11060 [Janthinobacterium sp. B9-8]
MSYEEETEDVPFTAEIEAEFRQIARGRAPVKLAQLAEAQGDTDAFAHLPSAAAAAFHLEQFADAKQFAERALALAPAFKENWNYGNAIHCGHSAWPSRSQCSKRYHRNQRAIRIRQNTRFAATQYFWADDAAC